MHIDVSETTDRFCDSCGEYAMLGVGRKKPYKKNPEGVEKWFCEVCFDLYIGPTDNGGDQDTARSEDSA
jgi:hypothetical protein